MKIAYAIYQSGTRTNGALTSISLLLDAILERTDIEHIIITNAESETTKNWKTQGREVFIVPYADQALEEHPYRTTEIGRSSIDGAVYLENLPRLRPRLIELLREKRIDVLHCNDVQSFVFASWSARHVGTRLVLTLRGTSALHDQRSLMARMLCSATIALSDELKEQIETSLRGTSPVHVIPSIVASPILIPKREARDLLKMDAHAKTIGVIARFEGGKRQLKLLKALADEISPPAFELYLIGDLGIPREIPPTYLSRCETQIRRNPLLGKHVHVVGLQTNLDLWYQALDLVLITSHHEGLSRAMIESLAHGTPVLSTDVCSAEETLEIPGCGEVMRTNDFSELIHRADLLLRSPEKLATMGRRGTELAAVRFAPEKAVASHLTLYRSLLETP